jgi:class 3 adenylate cyclase
LVLWLLLLSGVALSAQYSPEAVNGVLDLRAADFSRQPVWKLEGAWEFHNGRLLYPSDLATMSDPATVYSVIPSTWNSQNGNQNWGYASYRLKVLLPPSHPALAIRIPVVAMNHRLWVNGTEVDAQGVVGTSADTAVSGWKPGVHMIPAVGDQADILIQVSNFDDQSGGLYNTPEIGEAEALFQARNAKTLLDVLVFGGLFMMGLYYLGLFAYRPKDRSSLFFALLCLGLSLRQLCYGELVISDVFPDLPFNVIYRAGYILYAGALAVFVRFLEVLFPAESWKPAVVASGIVCGAYMAICLFLPPWIFASILIGFQVFTIAVGIYALVVLGRGIAQRKRAAFLLLAGFLVLFACTVVDILKGYFAWQTPDLTSYGLVAFLFAQSLILARTFAEAFAATEKFADHLESLNASLERFIPREVLAFLKKDSVMDIKLGDHVEREMTVMFADIRDFTSLSEAMTPRENFNFINSYLERMGPVIRKHHGFVDKYLGDGIMALFPGSPDHALHAILELQETLVIYNGHRAKHGYRPIRVGYGIHAGTLMMGTIGESRRMDSTVISDTVNVASRLEGLTKKFGVTLLTSEAFINRLEHPESFEFRFVAEETVKGKSQAIKVYEVLGLKN